MPEEKAAIIVTGSNGFIGRAVCTAFASDGFAVLGLDRADSGKPPSGITNLPCDVTSEGSVADAVSRIRRNFRQPIASVIHLAAYYDFSGEPSRLYDEVTVQGTERLVRFLRPLRPQQFVFSSTMLVHAPCVPGQRIDEDSPIDPRWEYPKSKVRTEKMLLAERGSMPVVLLRLAGVYTDQCQSIPLAHQIQRIYERRLTARVFPGDTTTGQSFVHLDDVVEAMRRAVARRATLPSQAAILIGEPETLGYDELQRIFAALIHGERDWDTAQIPKAVAKAGAWVQDQIPGIEEPFIKPFMIDLADDHYALDIKRARELLGWSPRRSLRDTIPRMVEALKTDPGDFYRTNKLEGEPPEEAASVEARAAGSRRGR